MKIGMMSCAFFLCCGLMSHSAVAQQSGPVVEAAPGQQQIQPSSPIFGEWRGQLGRLHLVFTVEHGTGAALTGRLVSVDQGGATVTFDTVTLSPEGVVHFSMKAEDAAFDGKLSVDGKILPGTWTQSGNVIPLILRRPGAEMASFTLKPRTMGTVALMPCRTPDGNTEGLCGTYAVWENRATKTGRKIDLRLMVLPALAERSAAEPFVPLAGGPGQGAVDSYPLIGYVSLIRRTRDVVLIDQRGTGGSHRLDCAIRDPKSARENLEEATPVDRLQACVRELSKGADLTQYGTIAFTDDLDEVLTALGYGKVDLFGTSYGTESALVFLRMYPGRVRSIGLEGVVPPEYRIPSFFAKSTDEAVANIIARCAADVNCHAAYPQLAAEYTTLLERLSEEPAHFEAMTPTGPKEQISLSKGAFVASLRPILYIPPFLAAFPLMVHRAYNNDWSVYAGAALTIRLALEKELARGLSESVICPEDVDGVSAEEESRATLGTGMGNFQVHLYEHGCAVWPRGKVPKDFHTPVRSAVPALLISGALDPATPPETAAQAALGLSHAQRIVVQNGTHGTGSPCIDGVIARFVASGGTEQVDASCLSGIKLPSFTLDLAGKGTMQ